MRRSENLEAMLEKTIFGFPNTTSDYTLKLMQEPRVVSKQIPDIRDLMADHAQSFDAESECKTTDFL